MGNISSHAVAGRVTASAFRRIRAAAPREWSSRFTPGFFTPFSGSALRRRRARKFLPRVSPSTVSAGSIGSQPVLSCYNCRRQLRQLFRGSCSRKPWQSAAALVDAHVESFFQCCDAAYAGCSTFVKSVSAALLRYVIVLIGVDWLIAESVTFPIAIKVGEIRCFRLLNGFGRLFLYGCHY